jgi:hypothetical protein
MSQAAKIKCLWGLSAVFATVALALAIFFIISSVSAVEYKFYKKIPGEKCDGTGGGAGAECVVTEDQCLEEDASECTPDQCTPTT